MSDDEKSTLDELFSLRHEVKALRAQLEAQAQPVTTAETDTLSPAELRSDAATLMEAAAQMIREADAIDSGAPAPAPVIEPRPSDPGTAQDILNARIRRQAWGLFGQLVLCGIVQPPTLDTNAGELIGTAQTLDFTLTELEVALTRIDQETVDVL
jgi:hypothetical protein